ncbi:MAG: sigma-54 dependent transcriptional regulator [Candidatus Zixiibacteriota bacterium]
MCEFMKIMLGKEGYEVDAEQSGRRAIERVSEKPYDMVIADLMMPEMSGLQVLDEIRETKPDLPFLVMTAFASVETAIEALKKGASDYITKPFKVDEIKLAIQKTLETRELRKENLELKALLNSENAFDRLIGDDPQIRKVKAMAAEVAATDATILVRGESGTGKDLLASAIHHHSPRRDKPFVTVNCGALPETLLESELFGHTKGSFTGAIRDHGGLFRAAQGGTLFLDEIGETTQAIQVKLLRVLEDKKVTPIGSTVGIPVDVRLITATNADLEGLVQSGKFRADLYYRLNVIQINVPPLRERVDDIDMLADHFIIRSCKKTDSPSKTISERARRLLRAYHWPGNVRELQNVIERAVVLSKSNVLDVGDFPEKLSATPVVTPATDEQAETPTLESIEKAYIYWVLNQTDWQKAKAAQILGIDNSTLYRKINKYNLSKSDEK